MAPSVQPGDQAPELLTPFVGRQDDHVERLPRKSEVVLFFYPKDDSPACTVEACSFRDSHEDFLDAGAVVIRRQFRQCRRAPGIRRQAPIAVPPADRRQRLAQGPSTESPRRSDVPGPGQPI